MDSRIKTPKNGLITLTISTFLTRYEHSKIKKTDVNYTSSKQPGAFSITLGRSSQAFVLDVVRERCVKYWLTNQLPLPTTTRMDNYHKSPCGNLPEKWALSKSLDPKPYDT